MTSVEGIIEEVSRGEINHETRRKKTMRRQADNLGKDLTSPEKSPWCQSMDIYCGPSIESATPPPPLSSTWGTYKHWNPMPS